MPSRVMPLKEESSKLDLAPPKHGGDLVYWQRKIGSHALNWLDLSSACNREPWPIPKIAPELWMALPDQATLLNGAETYYGRKPSAIGAGSQHIIESLPIFIREKRALKNNRVFVPKVGYQEHGFAWRKWGFELVYYDSIETLLEHEFAVAVVINPNNPTGEWAAKDSLFSLIEHIEKQGASLIIDEAFIDPCPEQSLLVEEYNHWPDSLFLLRSVGKFFGLAGARVGFVFCADKWQSAFQNLLGPWPVATPSLHLVNLAIADVAWQSQALEALKQRQAVFVEKVMPKLNTIFDSQNSVINPLFITWYIDSGAYAEQVFEMLHQVGVHIRLGEGWVRIALPAMDEMETLNKALVQLLKGAGGGAHDTGIRRGELS